MGTYSENSNKENAAQDQFLLEGDLDFEYEGQGDKHDHDI